ncbi:hypothetical protein GA0061070_1008104 [Kosakonia oryziphila]|uniref:Uncharacterized protein n=1 Tax=Kosakonia oryziphila TaxID=1005667 RepID=A0A1C4BQB6_9ENTR|nr:hypothetical protein GA0061070_1008104 [Kosakonia oryziphila]
MLLCHVVTHAFAMQDVHIFHHRHQRLKEGGGVFVVLIRGFISPAFHQMKGVGVGQILSKGVVNAPRFHPPCRRWSSSSAHR